LEEVAGKMHFATAIKETRSSIKYKTYVIIKLVGCEFSTYLYICYLKDWNIILGDPTSTSMGAIIDI